MTDDQYQFPKPTATHQKSDGLITTSVILAAVNLFLFISLIVTLGPEVGIQFLVGFDVDESQKQNAGGLFYAIGVLLVFLLRLAFLPATAIISLVGIRITFPSISGAFENRQHKYALIVFHIVCLVPAIIFLIRTIVFVATN